MNNRNEILGIIGGIFIALMLNLLVASGFFFIGTLFGGLFLIPIGGIGILQVSYIIPYAMKLRRDGQIGMMKGLIIGAVIVALLNGACWVSLMSYYK